MSPTVLDNIYNISLGTGVNHHSKHSTGPICKISGIDFIDKDRHFIETKGGVITSLLGVI